MYIGRYPLGSYVVFPMFCRANSATEVAPTSAPQISVYKTDDTPVVDDISLAPWDKPTRTGWFNGGMFLDETYSAGRYNANVTYVSGGSTYSNQFEFEVIPGGDTKGAYAGMTFYRRPHADFVVGYTVGGDTEFRRNPKAY